MNAAETLVFTRRSIGSNRLRSFLTTLGIAIGVTAVVLLTSFGAGLEQYIVREFSQFGSHNLVIMPGKPDTVGIGPPGVVNTQRPLTIEDAAAVAGLPNVEASIPVRVGTLEVKANNRVRETLILGGTSEIIQLLFLELNQGQFLPDDSSTSPRALAVLGSTVYRDMYGENSPLDDRIRIAGSRFRVIGVLEDKGDVLGVNVDDLVIIPAARMLELYNSESLMEIDVRYSEHANPDELVASIKRLLIARHSVEDFSVITQQQILDSLGSILDVITAAVAALGAISLLVGGVGIFTIMTISVRERTHEIGLLRAVGATRLQVRNLFLSESVLLAASGAIIGLLFGSLLVLMLGALISDLPARLSPFYMFAAVIVAVVIGVIAGITPSSRAAKLEPLDALRAA